MHSIFFSEHYLHKVIPKAALISSRECHPTRRLDVEFKIKNKTLLSMSKILCLSLMLSGNILGAVTLCTMESDIDKDVGILGYEYGPDQKEVTYLTMETVNNGRSIRFLRFPIAELKSENGILLQKDGSYEVIILRSQNFNNQTGGSIVVDSLYDGMFGKRKSYQLETVFDGQKFILLNNQQYFNKIFVTGNRSRLFGVIGIKSMRFEQSSSFVDEIESTTIEEMEAIEAENIN